MNKLFDNKIGLLVSGLVLGALICVLIATGNPGNMAICVACFIRDIAGATKFHTAGVVQYFRPEIVGFVLGSFIIANASKEFKVVSGGAPLTKLLLGACTMILALVFLGCPLRMILRMSGGDLNAYVAFVGFVVGILAGIFFLKNGYELTEAKKENSSVAGYIIPLVLVIVLVLYNLPQTTQLFGHSEKGPGSLHAPVILALVIALIIGMVAQKSRMCFAGSIRNIFLTKDLSLFLLIFGIYIVVMVYNIINGKFNLSFTGQPIAHTEGLWNFLSMFGVGLAATFAGGCPLRQLILTGEGHIDNALNVVGMLIGAAIAHNFSLASSGDGTTAGGRVATIVCLIIVLIIGFSEMNKKKA